jgi:hypothetical protein
MNQPAARVVLSRLLFGVRGCAGADVGIGVVGAPVSCDASGDELRRPVRSRRAAVLNGVSKLKTVCGAPLTEFCHPGQ